MLDILKENRLTQSHITGHFDLYLSLLHKYHHWVTPLLLQKLTQ